MEFMKRKFHSDVSKTEELQVFIETSLDFKGILKVFIMYVQLAAVGRLPYETSCNRLLLEIRGIGKDINNAW